jgi:hypothetical protein
MEIEQILELRKKLEGDLLSLFQKFNEETGLIPDSIKLEHKDIIVYGKNDAKILLGVRVNIQI